MSEQSALHDVLLIPKQHQKKLSSDRILCLVTDDWLHSLRQKTIKDIRKSSQLAKADADLLLAPSYETLPRHWKRVCVKVIAKSSDLVPRLHNGPLYNTSPVSGGMEHLVQTARDNFRNLWAAAHVGHNSNMNDTFHAAEEQFSDVLRHYLLRFYPDVYIKLPVDTAPPTGNHRHNTQHVNIIQTHAIVETDTTFFIVQPYVPCTLSDVVSYSPAVFNTSHSKSLFVLYQILHAMIGTHTQGVSCGDLNLHNILIDKKLWVHLSIPHVTRQRGGSECEVGDQCGSTSSQHTPADASLAPGSDVSCDDKAYQNSSVSDVTISGKERSFSMSSVSERLRLPTCDNLVEDARLIIEQAQYQNFQLDDRPKLTEDWVSHKISNFKYLMVLNHLAGRRIGDPNHHPVLPWVMDFTNPDSGYRDLTMSKFRLNKGDSQLDFTYESMSELSGSSDQIPHHVSDVLSDITYYVYKARKTPINILCTYVRSKWVPNEYPISIVRMYEWTPDECIPEFFIDPTIFTSIHEDLPDLGLPTWCVSTAEFITRHMTVLESEQVSCQLHHWIDLTFGCKLTGTSAIESKNVYLKLVDDHKHVTNHGVVPLFSHPHPYRLPRDKGFSVLSPRIRKHTISDSILVPTESKEAERPENATIKLPNDLDPTAALDHFEALNSFCDQSKSEKSKARDGSRVTFASLHKNMRQVWRDMQQFGCLMCELYLSDQLHSQTPGASLIHRYNTVARLLAHDRNSLPRLAQTAVDVLLQLDRYREPDEAEYLQTGLLFEYPMVNALGLPPPSPALLIQPYSQVLPFPDYFPELYTVLCQMKAIDSEIVDCMCDGAVRKSDRAKLEKMLARRKVDLIERYLYRQRGAITAEGYELVLPYVEELFQDATTAVQAAWSLVNVVGKGLGHGALARTLLPYLAGMLGTGETTAKHMKLYHRAFLVQLLLRLGLDMFLRQFATLLVEAVAGYKNFVVDDADTALDDADTAADDLDDDACSDGFVTDVSTVDDMDTSHNLDDHPAHGMSEDVRPDLDDDTEPSDVPDDDLLDEDFPPCRPRGNTEPHGTEDTTSHHTGDTASHNTTNNSADSLNMDRMSEVSNDSDQGSLREDNSTEDHASCDCASVHSITHIIEMSLEKKLAIHAETTSEHLSDDDTRSATAHVQFENNHSETVLAQNSQSEAFDYQTSQSKENLYSSNKSNSAFSKSPTYMIRSETDEFSQIHKSHTINICDIAAESIKWLSHRLGPLLTSKFLSKNLVRMLALCYLGEEQVQPLLDTVAATDLPKSTKLLLGDRNAHKVLECLGYVASLYGEQVILLQYLPCIVDMIHVAKKRLTSRAEAGLVAAMVLLRQVIPLLSDGTLIDILEESIIKDALRPVLRLLSSADTSFPSGSSVRAVILYKLVDVLYIVGLRLGFELTRQHMTPILQAFFKPFDRVYAGEDDGGLPSAGSSTGDIKESPSSTNLKECSSIDESYLNIKMDDATHQYTIGSPVTLAMLPPTHPASPSPRKWRAIRSSYSLSSGHLLDEKDDVSETRGASEENIRTQLRQTFSPDLALAAYIPLTSIFGSHHMEEKLSNDDLIRKLCAQYDEALYTDNDGSTHTSYTAAADTPSPDQDGYPPADHMGSNVEVVGNRICLTEDGAGTTMPGSSQLRAHFPYRGILRIDPDDTKCADLERNKHRHLRGNWLAYWEHELGLNERDTMFNFKQIKLQTFVGHTNSIRSLTGLDSENSFISASKDKTVKLWSLTSFGDGSGRCKYQWSYEQHKKSVFSVAYLENMRLVASCDSTVHIWDPFTGDTVRQLESSRYSPVIALTALPSPSTAVITATTDTTIRFLDLRSASYAHEYKCALGSPGMIRCITVSPDGSWVAVGFSSGIISLLDLHTGVMLGSWKGHDSEILQLKAYCSRTFLSTAFDLNMKLWSVEDGREVCTFRGHTEPAHCLTFYRAQVVSATTNNKIGVHTSVDAHANFSSTKLQSEMFKGVLTSMAVLPLNRTLLLGADNGTIRLFC